MWCRCIEPVGPRAMWPYLLDEVREFVAEPSRDEASDVIWSLSRLLGGLFGRVYLPLPGIGRHVREMDARMARWGCVRSEHHPHCSGREA